MSIQTTPDIDLTACEREPIHIPGSIQPHGILLALRSTDRALVYASANIASLLGLEPAAVLGRPFGDVMPDLAARFDGDLAEPAQQGTSRYLRTITLETKQGERAFDAVLHRSGDYTVLELEEVPAGSSASLDTLYPTLRRFVEQLQTATTIDDLCRVAAQDIRRLTGFDRVLVYRFDEQWNGTVIAEDRNENLPSYLDLRFPASDIPAQARELYRRNRLRIIPDAD
ncbi:PAS domain-containing protein [Microvirga lenta]|uniref:PAS domain-containing protein n=1 Tax=Microvirga lenta TaxID=2881337 RepID=UPI001CFCCFF1|nr:PAS domain-containing protein [Microvirga lenta]MCB5174532.1 PAS domain-containing protein [Microvirga lenta]